MGHIDLVKLFLAKNVNLELRDENGYTAAYWAHQNKHTTIVPLLPPPQGSADGGTDQAIASFYDQGNKDIIT